MYNMLQQLGHFAYNQLLSKKVSSTKIDASKTIDVEGKDVPHTSKNISLQEISANLEESERILLENSKISCREMKSKSDTDIKDTSKTVLNKSKKCLSLSDLKRHIASMNIKKFTRTPKKDIIKPHITSSSGDSEKKYESIKSPMTDETPSSCDLFGFYKNRRRKHISPYELYVQSVKPIISNNFNKLKKCGSKDIGHEKSAKHITFLSSHHGLKVITSNHRVMKVAIAHEDVVFDSLQCFQNRGELNNNNSIQDRQDHNKKKDLPFKHESIMCHITENRKDMHHPKKKRRVSYSIPKDNSVDVSCDNVSADQSLGTSELVTQNLPPKHEVGCSPILCDPKCEWGIKSTQSMKEEIDNGTQTNNLKHSYKTHKFSYFLPEPYKKSVQCVANLQINNPDPRSIVKCVLIGLVVMVWSPILVAIGIGWLLSYPLRPCIAWERNLPYNRKKVCTCKNSSNYHKSRQTMLQYMVKTCTQPSQRQNQKQKPCAWRKLCSCRRRDHRRNYCAFHADCKTNPLHASQHRANTFKNFFHAVFCSCDKIDQSNVSSFRARRNRVASKKKNLKKPTLNDNRTRHPIIEFSQRLLQNSEAIKIYPIQEEGTTTEPKIKSVSLQTHDHQSKSDNEMKYSSMFSPFLKLVENYLVHSKFITTRQQTFSRKSTNGQGWQPKNPHRQCFPRPTSILSKNLRGHPRYSRKPNITMGSPLCFSLVSKETQKAHNKRQKIIKFADTILQNTETSKLTNKYTNTDPLNQQIQKKNLFWKVSQTTDETETNIDESTQKLVRHRKHETLHSPKFPSPHNEENKCLHQVSSHCISPMFYKIKEANTTIDADFPLSETTKNQRDHSDTAYEPATCGRTEPLCQSTKEVNTTTEINIHENPNSSFNIPPSALSKPNKHPIGDDFSDYKCYDNSHAESICETIKANAAIGTDQNSEPCNNNDPKNFQCIKKNENTQDRSSFFKFPVSTKSSWVMRYKIKKTNVSNGSDQNPQPSDSCHKLTQGSPNSKYPINSDAECSCGHKRNKANATVRMNQKSKSNSSCQHDQVTLATRVILDRPNFGPTAGSSECKCSMIGNIKNVCPPRNMKNAAVKTDQKSMSNSSCQCHLLKPFKFSPAGLVVNKSPISRNIENLCQNCREIKKENVAVETDKKSNSNTSCQCHLIKPINFVLTGPFSRKFPINGSTESLRHNRNAENACDRMDRNSKLGPNLKNPPNKNHERPLNPKIFNITKYLKGVKKVNNSCQCHLLKPTLLPPDVSSFCKWPSIAKSESLCHFCQKKSANKDVKTRQYSELSSSCDFQRSKYIYSNNVPHDGSQEVTEAIGTDPKLKFSSCERMKLNNVPSNLVQTTFQQDALNVYKLCPIRGDTDSLKNTKLIKKYSNNKIATNKRIHTPEYLKVCSEVFGSLEGENLIAHSLSNNNEKCRMNKETRTSKCRANSPRNTKSVNKCIRESIEAKPPNNLKSLLHDNVCSGQVATVGCSCCNIRGSNESQENTEKIKNNSCTGNQHSCTIVANKHYETKIETQSAEKPIQATKTKICADKNTICALLPTSEQTYFPVEERKCCSSQTFKNASFATPYSLSYFNAQKCKKSKQSRVKYLAYSCYNFIVGKKRRKKINKDFETIQSCGILINTSNCKKQKYKTESRECYGDSTKPKSRKINTGVSPINSFNKIGNLKTDGRKNVNNKSMEFSYFTMLKDLIDSKTLQNRDVCAKYIKSNEQQSKQNSPCNKKLEMRSDDHLVPPLAPYKCSSPRISSVRPLEYSVITECKRPIPDPKPSCPKSCSCEYGVSENKKQQKRSSPHKSYIRGKKQQQGCSSQTHQKLNATRCSNTPGVSSIRNKIIQQKLAKLRGQVSSQVGSNILAAKKTNLYSQICSNILEKKNTSKNSKFSCELISGKGDGHSNKTIRGHFRPYTQAMVTDKGDNSLNFNYKRDLIKMCSKRKVKLTPSLVKCLSDSFNLVSNPQKQLPRIIDHIKSDKCCKQNKRSRIKLESTGTTQICKATGIEKDCACTQVNKPKRHNEVKCENRNEMGSAGQCKKCKYKKHKRKTRKKKPHSSKIHHTKIPERKGFWAQHFPHTKKTVNKIEVKKKVFKNKTIHKKAVKTSKKQTSTYSEGKDEIQCSDLYLVTLRKRPWFWVYKLLPKCYPNFLRFRLCSKTVCTQCAFSLTCCLWAPFVVSCFVCYELFSCCH